MPKGHAPPHHVTAPVQPQRLTAPIGWIETRFNRGRFDYAAGEVVGNPDEIEMLRRRGAMLEDAECQAPPTSPPDH